MERIILELVQDHRRLIEDFCKDCKLRGMTSESVRRYKSSLIIFAGFLQKRGVAVAHARIACQRPRYFSRKVLWTVRFL
jgi:hypothetical protein